MSDDFFFFGASPQVGRGSWGMDTSAQHPFLDILERNAHQIPGPGNMCVRISSIYRSLLQKRPMILRSLQIVTTPYANAMHSEYPGQIMCVSEYHLFYRVLLQKRPMMLRSLLIVAAPYANGMHSKYPGQIICVSEKQDEEEGGGRNSFCVRGEEAGGWTHQRNIPL